ncbi:MAG: hypothetical protein RI907_2301 [Pseudomonadota bacterium]|jgi:sulfite exporter TauE/SafE
MLGGLMLTALLMGVGGAPHCAAMCGAACSVVFPRGVPIWSLVGRCLAYAALGAVAAASAGLVSGWGRQMVFLQPFWVMAQTATFFMGLWLLATGRMPMWVEAAGHTAFHAVRSWWQGRQPLGGERLGVRWTRQMLGGMAWVFLPCGLLYAALMTAGLADSPLEGAIVMLCFAAPGAVGVWAAPALLAKLRGRASVSPQTPVPVIWMRAEGQGAPLGSGPHAPGNARSGELAAGAPARLNPDDVRWAIRLSGAMLAAMSAYGAYHLLWMKWQAWCA